MFVGCSLIGFYEMFQDLLKRGCAGRTADVGLLTVFSQALGRVPHPNYQDSYCARVHRNLVWCAEVVKTLAEQGQQSSSGSTPSSFQTATLPAQGMPSDQLKRVPQQEPPLTGQTMVSSGFFPYQPLLEESSALASTRTMPFSYGNQPPGMTATMSAFDASGSNSTLSQSLPQNLTGDSNSTSPMLGDWADASGARSFNNVGLGDFLQSSPVFPDIGEDFGLDIMSSGQGYDFLVNELQRGAC